jgi:DinB superfamily
MRLTALSLTSQSYCMIEVFKKALWKNFGASIDMLRNAIQLWPEEYWNTDRKFFYSAYHCLIFLDYSLSIPPTDFTTPLPFTISATGQLPSDAIDDVVPDSIYTKKELLDYLQASREKCHLLIRGLTEEKLNEKWIERPDELSASVTLGFSVLEILFYNLRHVQHHTAQLNLLLRQKIDKAPDWIAEADDNL